MRGLRLVEKEKRVRVRARLVAFLLGTCRNSQVSNAWYGASYQVPGTRYRVLVYINLYYVVPEGPEKETVGQLDMSVLKRDCVTSFVSQVPMACRWSLELAGRSAWQQSG